MSFIVGAVGLAYLACVLFFQAGERRTQLAGIKASSNVKSSVRIGAWLLLLLALSLLSLSKGLELGITIWLGVVSCAGGTSLLVSALAPRWHWYSALAVLGVCACIILAGLVRGSV